MFIIFYIPRQGDYILRIWEIKCSSSLWGFLVNEFTSSTAIIVVCNFLFIKNSLSWIFKVQWFWFRVKILPRLTRLLLSGVIIEEYGCLGPSGLVFITHLLVESLCFLN